MQEKMVTVARYRDAVLAHRHAGLLRQRGIQSELETLDLFDALAEKKGVDGEVLLKVAPEDVDEVAELWEELDLGPKVSQKGEGLMLGGAAIAISGVLTTFSQYGSIGSDFFWVPCGLAAAGICFFLRGLMIEQGGE